VPQLINASLRSLVYRTTRTLHTASRTMHTYFKTMKLPCFINLIAIKLHGIARYIYSTRRMCNIIYIDFLNSARVYWTVLVAWRVWILRVIATNYTKQYQSYLIKNLPDMQTLYTLLSPLSRFEQKLNNTYCEHNECMTNTCMTLSGNMDKEEGMVYLSTKLYHFGVPTLNKVW